MKKERTRRLFFALWPDDRTRQALFHWQVHNLPGDLRWQHRADLHMTLHFLGQVDPARLEALCDLGAEAAGEYFVVVLDEIGHWPRPQVLWAAPSSLPGELLQLHARLATGLNALGLQVETRVFRPHVTLARKVRNAPTAGPLAVLAWPVTEMALVESRAGDAPNYHPLARWTLK
ncbi:MAG: RNA 2',3'-cyclic phosphodiesterase [Sedimenticolaceae bacterium]